MTIDVLLERRGNYDRPLFLDIDRPRRDVTALTRQARFVALAAHLQARLSDVVIACYERTQCGEWWNVDGVTGRILIPLPWASYSHKQWGLYRSECDILRACVYNLRNRHSGPFFFDRTSTRWHLDLVRYPDLHTLTATPEAWTLTPDMLQAADAWIRAAGRDTKRTTERTTERTTKATSMQIPRATGR
jgi:hypothetical protein